MELKDVRHFCLETIALKEILKEQATEWLVQMQRDLMEASEPLSAIDQIMTPEGDIRTDASEKLYSLFNEKNQLVRQVQNILDKLVKQHEMEPVLQDRYVTHAPWTKRQGQVLLVWKDVLWLIGGLEPKLNTGVGDTWFTTDGINWQKTNTDGPWRGREDHGVAVWRDALWLVGGMNDQWTWDEGVWKGSISSTTKKI
jgi:hypothetical protein